MSIRTFVRSALALASFAAMAPVAGCAAQVGDGQDGVESTSQASTTATTIQCNLYYPAGTLHPALTSSSMEPMPGCVAYAMNGGDTFPVWTCPAVTLSNLSEFTAALKTTVVATCERNGVVYDNTSTFYMEDPRCLPDIKTPPGGTLFTQYLLSDFKTNWCGGEPRIPAGCGNSCSYSVPARSVTLN